MLIGAYRLSSHAVGPSHFNVILVHLKIILLLQSRALPSFIQLTRYSASSSIGTRRGSSRIRSTCRQCIIIIRRSSRCICIIMIIIVDVIILLRIGHIVRARPRITQLLLQSVIQNLRCLREIHQSNFLVNKLRNNRAYIINLTECFKQGNHLEETPVIWIIVPTQNGNGILRMEIVGVW